MKRPRKSWSWPRLIVGGAVCLLLSLACWPGMEPPIKAQTIEVYYAPEDRPGDRLVELYDGATHSIYIAAYGITYRPGVRALVRAKERGVDVRIITDGEMIEYRLQRAALETLRRADIPIKVDRHEGRMHLKQVVVDENVNTSGSMNLTTSG